MHITPATFIEFWGVTNLKLNSTPTEDNKLKYATLTC